MADWRPASLLAPAERFCMNGRVLAELAELARLGSASGLVAARYVGAGPQVMWGQSGPPTTGPLVFVTWPSSWSIIDWMSLQW